MLLVILCFSLKKGFIVFQNCLLSVTSFTLTLSKCFLDSFRGFEQRLRWHLYSNQFSIFLSLLNLFLNLGLFIIASGRVFVTKVWLLFRIKLKMQNEMIQNLTLRVINFLLSKFLISKFFSIFVWGICIISFGIFDGIIFCCQNVISF